MKSLVSIVNTGELATMQGMEFPTGIPVVVYRSSVLFEPQEAIGTLALYFDEGRFFGYEIDGSKLSADDAVRISNRLCNQISRARQEPSYSFAYHWNKATCSDLLDGFKRRIDLFDFDGPSVAVSRLEVIRKSRDVLTCLSVGYLRDASAGIKSITPDGDDDFLSAAQLGQFIALFDSALVG